MRWTDPQVLSVLFSWNHGLFSWTPGLLVASCGLYWLVKRDTVLGLASVLVVFTAVYINASVEDWWAGEAFGARRFISYTVLFAIALTALTSSLDSFRRPNWIRFAAERDYANARYDYIINSLTLKSTTGDLQQGDLAAINQWLSETDTLNIYQPDLEGRSDALVPDARY